MALIIVATNEVCYLKQTYFRIVVKIAKASHYLKSNGPLTLSVLNICASKIEKKD